MSDSLYVRIRPDAHRASTTRRVSPYGEATMNKGPVYEVHPAHAIEFRASPQTFDVFDAAPSGFKIVPYARPAVKQNAPKPPPPPAATPKPTPAPPSGPEEEAVEVAPTPPASRGKKTTRGAKKDGGDE